VLNGPRLVSIDSRPSGIIYLPWAADRRTENQRGQPMIDMVKEKLVSHGMKLMQSPAVSKLMESEKMGAVLEKAMSVPIKLSEEFRAKRERLTALFELATQQDLDEVKRSIARMEDLLHEIKSSSGDLLNKTAEPSAKEPVAR
jgi:hypothetical protein